MQDQATAGALVRFLIGGAINTVLTYALFLALSSFLHHALAYTIAYLAGIALAYTLAATFVFRTGLDPLAAFRFPLVYVTQYLYGLIVLLILIDFLDAPRQAAMLTVIATSIPLTFLLTKHLVAAGRGRESRLDA
jgi:putative flippase GtrA